MPFAASYVVDYIIEDIIDKRTAGEEEPCEEPTFEEVLHARAKRAVGGVSLPVSYAVDCVIDNRAIEKERRALRGADLR